MPRAYVERPHDRRLEEDQFRVIQEVVEVLGPPLRPARSVIAGDEPTADHDRWCDAIEMRSQAEEAHVLSLVPEGDDLRTGRLRQPRPPRLGREDIGR